MDTIENPTLPGRGLVFGFLFSAPLWAIGMAVWSLVS